MDALERARDKGHDMSEFGPGNDPVWPMPESKCSNCGLKLFQYEDSGNTYGAAALLSCEEMQRINKYSNIKHSSLMTEHRWVEWESLAEHSGNWVALAKHPDRRKRQKALEEYPAIFEEVKGVFVVLTDMTAELKRVMAKITELADTVIRENQVDPEEDDNQINPKRLSFNKALNKKMEQRNSNGVAKTTSDPATRRNTENRDRR